MTGTDMTPDDLRDAWRERGPKLEGLRVSKARSGEVTFKLGTNRLVAFLRAGEWRTRRRDGYWDKKRGTKWRRVTSESSPLGSFEDLVRLVLELRVAEKACG